MVKGFKWLWNNKTPITWGFVFRMCVIVYTPIIVALGGSVIFNKVKGFIAKRAADHEIGADEKK